jgi:3-oxoacyl-[acyl-carrier protein] reductase
MSSRPCASSSPSCQIYSKRGWGRIINVATGMATTPQIVMADYAAAKAAMVNSTVSLAKALAATGVTANTVSPGVIHTEGVERVLREAQ